MHDYIAKNSSKTLVIHTYSKNHQGYGRKIFFRGYPSIKSGPW